MHGKEFALDFIKTYFTIVALINVAILVLGLQFAPDNLFGYEAFSAPLLYGAAGTLPNIVMYSRRELTVKELLVRKLIQFISIEACVLFVAFYGADAFWQQPKIILGVGVSVFVVYVIASLIDWLQNYLSAKRMTEDLLQFQKGVVVKEEV